MKIRTKSFIAVSIITFMIFVALHLAAIFVLHPSFTNIEKEQINRSIVQIRNTINYKLESLEGNTKDYASWDDTYNFIKTRNQTYIDINLVDTTFSNLNLNLMAVTDTNNSLVFCKSFDLNNSVSIETSEYTKQCLTTDNALWNFSSPDSSITGIMLVENKLMLIATRPILTSNAQGPIIGGMLFGRYLDSVEIEQLKTITNLNFAIESITSFEEKQIATSLLSNNQVNIIKENNNEISGYALINDIHSNPTLILQVNEDRVLFQQGDFAEYVFIAASAVLTIILAIVTIYMLEKYVFKPMANIATSIETAPYESNAKRNSSDEISIVENTVKNMVNKKMDAMNEVSTMVAHDLRNPLQGICGASYYLRKNLPKRAQLIEKDIEMLDTIDNCVTYSNKIVSDLLDYSSKIKLDLVKTTVKVLLTESLAMVSAPGNIKVLKDFEKNFDVVVDKVKTERVFGNLIKNAFDAMPTGGELHISSKKIGKKVRIDFSDTGTGMSKEVLSKIWTPFFTTKAKGMGIGLSICKRIIEEHNGKIEVESKEGKGTKFTVFLPL
jgi:signal transduction histidine kinase